MRSAYIINVWLWTQLTFIFFWLPGLSEGLQITGKELGDMCSHLICGEPSKNCQETTYLSKQVNACQRKKDFIFGMETGGQGWKGEGRLSPSERSSPRGWRRCQGVTLGNKWRLVKRSIFGCHSYDTSQLSPNFTPGNLVLVLEREAIRNQAIWLPFCANSGGVTQGQSDCGLSQSTRVKPPTVLTSERWPWVNPWTGGSRLQQLFFRLSSTHHVWSLHLLQKCSRSHHGEKGGTQWPRRESWGVCGSRWLSSCSTLKLAFIPITIISQPFIWPFLLMWLGRKWGYTALWKILQHQSHFSREFTYPPAWLWGAHSCPGNVLMSQALLA